MNRVILEIRGASRGGSEWHYSFRLQRAKDRSLMLTCEQSSNTEYLLDLTPATDLASGVDVYRALEIMLATAEYELATLDTEAIAAAIAPQDAALAAGFRAAPSTIELQDEAERQAELHRRQAVLTPLATSIESYVARFSDERLHYPGNGRVYPSKRHWARQFIQEYVLAHGRLPTGKHLLSVRGYSGAEHDFTDFGESPERQ